ncbi:MAG: phosphoribosylformylglycinamidine synthase [Anaerolineaceae bacterium]|nr:phosphoribosylformylglycinamidine synthase [Anaerolineaceae bacterium]
MIENLEKNTGKSLDEWVAIARASGLEKHGQIVKFLKSEHGFTHGYANLVSIKARETAASPKTDDDLVENQYSGKEDLRPIYDALIDAVNQFGDDVVISPKKAYVSLRRNKQFGLVQPSTKTRVDVGLNLSDVVADGRLEKSGSFNSMVSHRVRLSSADEVDDELVSWLRQAYDQA